MPLPAFQEEAARCAVDRLCDSGGSRRFLLADEVGLGKTHVAIRTVELLEKELKRPLRFVYLCSSQAIVAQNRSKLRIDDDVHRATDLARRRRRPGRVALTPGTSLRGGTGTGRERALLLDLVRDVLRVVPGKKRPRAAWSLFFQVGVRDDERWAALVRAEWKARRYPKALKAAVRKAWMSCPTDGESLSQRLLSEVVKYERDVQAPRRRRQAGRRRTALVSELREALQHACVQWLAPDLVVVDEVQRFRDVLEEGREPELHGDATPAERRESHSHRALGKVLFGRHTRVLILSATPWQALSLSGDRTRHRRELRQTLSFLHRSGQEAEKTLTLLEPFARKILEDRSFVHALDPKLREAKIAVEKRLRSVMSRTERSWFISPKVEPDPPPVTAVPTLQELRDFATFSTFMRDRAGAASLGVELWKSCPLPLTFLDPSYATFDKLRTSVIPDGIVADAAKLELLSNRNHRMRELRRLVRNGIEDTWKHLWLPPRIAYYQSPFSEGAAPSKALVFSSWRFVPRAIAAVISADVERSVGIAARPLPRGNTLAFHRHQGSVGPILDLCMPSNLLAGVVDPLAGADASRNADELIDVAQAELRRVFAQRGVKVVARGGLGRWKVLARVDTEYPNLADLSSAIWKLERLSLSEPVRRVYARFLRWRSAQAELSISEGELRKLAEAAAFSPATAALRALRRVRSVPGAAAMSEDAKQTAAREFSLLVWFGMDPLRHYFGRAMTQAVIRAACPASPYPQRVLRYCREGQIQAVLDEYLQLAHDADPRCHPVIALANVLSPIRNTTHVYERGRNKKLKRRAKPVRTHVALAFGEEGRDPRAAERPASQSDVAKAFNSPFWPFVLATTSVGQEGLDFHLYCRDIVHWNLPPSPVDFEQREGRINRRQGFAIRDRLANAWKNRGKSFADDLELDRFRSPWKALFHVFEQDEAHHLTYGLHPHWILAGEYSAPALNRHLFYYDGSADEARLALLRKRLLSYRLVFGQPDQELLLDVMGEELGDIDHAKLRSILPAYLVNLAPITDRYLRQAAKERANAILESPERLAVLRGRVAEMFATHEELRGAGAAIKTLDELVAQHAAAGGAPTPDVVTAVATLWYLHHPFDLEFDAHAHVGFSDDLRLLNTAAAALGAG